MLFILAINKRSNNRKAIVFRFKMKNKTMNKIFFCQLPLIVSLSELGLFLRRCLCQWVSGK